MSTFLSAFTSLLHNTNIINGVKFNVLYGIGLLAHFVIDNMYITGVTCLLNYLLEFTYDYNIYEVYNTCSHYS